MTLNIETMLTIAGAALAGMAWLIRLESRVGTLNEKAQDQKTEISSIRQAQSNINDRILNELQRLAEALARIEGRMGHSDDRS